MNQEYICTICGHAGKPIKMSKGNILIEVLLWICFIVPGVIYTGWRFFVRYPACPICKKHTVIPLDSPMGQKLKRELNAVS